MPPLRVGIVGCGNICGIYFKNLQSFQGTDVVACADLDPAKADAASKLYNVAAMAADELIASDTVDLVLNLTVPNAHYEVAMDALRAGKHVYNEKPLALAREEGRQLVELAQETGLRLGCAPDTFLGAGLQACRQIIDEGKIGRPVAAQAFMLCHGHESWHPNPKFYYEIGGGPMFDMGPYYLTALIHLLGPMSRVTGSAKISFPTRTITSEPQRGATIEVETPTHIAGVIDFASGAVAQITTSFDVWPSLLPSIVIYGSEGTLIVPDPNGFGGEVLLGGRGEFEPVDYHLPFQENSRGVGVLDIANAIEQDRPHLASGDLALHVLDGMHAFLEASERGNHVELGTSCWQPKPFAPAFYQSEASLAPART